MARFGYLFLRNGIWKGERIVSEEWMDLARTPGVNKGYGFMNWFLNRPYTNDEGETIKSIPAAPESAVTFRGAGSNIVYIDWENDLVVVVRWIGSGYNEFMEKVLAAIEAPAPTENAPAPANR
jgi:CubicO group peptidase (beta-lactamase class C family)